MTNWRTEIDECGNPARYQFMAIEMADEIGRLRKRAGRFETALKVVMESVDACHDDPEAGLPSRNWHWYTEARDALEKS